MGLKRGGSSALSARPAPSGNMDRPSANRAPSFVGSQLMQRQVGTWFVHFSGLFVLELTQRQVGL